MSKITSVSRADYFLKHSGAILNNNEDMALIRLKSQEKSHKRKDSEPTHTYNKIIEDYKKKGYVKKIEKTNEINQWFLSHFAVIKEERTTTKTRIVFDAAAKDRGKSLKDAIRAGPKLQKGLIERSDSIQTLPNRLIRRYFRDVLTSRLVER